MDPLYSMIAVIPRNAVLGYKLQQACKERVGVRCSLAVQSGPRLFAPTQLNLLLSIRIELESFHCKPSKIYGISK